MELGEMKQKISPYLLLSPYPLIELKLLTDSGILSCIVDTFCCHAQNAGHIGCEVTYAKKHFSDCCYRNVRMGRFRIRTKHNRSRFDFATCACRKGHEDRHERKTNHH